MLVVAVAGPGADPEGFDEFEDARRLLMARYQQYTDAAQIGPFVAIDIDEWVGWQARECPALLPLPEPR